MLYGTAFYNIKDNSFYRKIYQMQHRKQKLITTNAYFYKNANERQQICAFFDSFGEQTITNIDNINLNISTMQTIAPEQSQTSASTPDITPETHIWLQIDGL